jgi:mannose-6-phosphate isomerase-like protein (cupin superfamily)
MGGRSLERFPVHLGRGVTATPQPEFTGAMDWYLDYASRTDADGKDGWLVATHRFTASWDSWEMHPAGHEVVCCLSGAMTLIQEFPDGHTEQVALGAGDYAINPPGVWHTADVAGEATALFITAGWGTEGRPR